MEVSLIQERQQLDKDEVIPATNTSPAGGKRQAFKRWLHYAVFGEEDEDNFNNDESVVIGDDDDLIFIPSLPRMPNSLFSSSNKDVSPLIFEESSNRENYKRQKLKDFKTHLKLKMHFAKGGLSENGEYSHNDKILYGRGSENFLECYHMFKSEPQDLDALFEYTMKSTSGPKYSSERIQVNYSDHDKDLALPPFQNLSYEDIDALWKNFTRTEQVVFSPLDIWDRSEEDNRSNYTNNLINQKIPNSSNLNREEDCPNLSLDSTEMESLMTSDSVENSTERSFERTSSIYLTDELMFKNATTREATFSEDNLPKITFYEEPDDIQTSRCSLKSSSVSSSNGSGESNTIIYTIPTFKQKRGELNVSGLVQSFRNGTLTEKNLNQMVKRGFQDVTFRSKEFYDEPPTSAQDIGGEQKEKDDSSSISSNEYDKKTECRDGTGTAGNGGVVKFDKYSCILVYRAAKRNSQSKAYHYTAPKGPHSRNDTFSARVDKKSSPLGDKSSKSILKKPANEKETEEIVRAKYCDKVDVKSFLAYFEHFEHQKHSEAANLVRFREQQLSHYYSQDFFPELLENIKTTRDCDSEYRRSKRATELNIGRKIGGGGLGCVHFKRQISRMPSDVQES